MQEQVAKLICVGFSLICAVATADGIFSIDDNAEMPDAVRKACSNVAIFAYKRPDPLYFTAQDFPRLEDALGAKIFELELLRKTKAECDKKNLKKCAWPYANFGSAFLLDSEDVLMTALHNLQPIFDQLQKETVRIPEDSKKDAYEVVANFASRQGKIEFFLFDQFGRVLYSPDSGDHATFETGMVPELLSHFFKPFPDQQAIVKKVESSSDFVKLRLSRKLDKGIAPLEANVLLSKTVENRFPLDRFGEEVYSCGLFDGGQKKGGSMIALSKGKIRERFPETRKQVKGDEIYLLDLAEMFSLTIEGTATPGMSGGPIMEAGGTVLSLLTTTYFDPDTETNGYSGPPPRAIRAFDFFREQADSK